MTLVYQDCGFVFAVKKADLEDELPSGFINVSVQKGRYLFSSIELVSGQDSVSSLCSRPVFLEENECPNEGCA
jgi:hypothetical protein